MVCPPKNHGPENPLCNHFYVLFYSPVPRRDFQDHGFEGSQTMVQDHGFARVGTMQVQAIMPFFIPEARGSLTPYKRLAKFVSKKGSNEAIMELGWHVCRANVARKISFEAIF